MKISNKIAIALTSCALILGSCSKTNTEKTLPSDGSMKYIIAATPIGTQNVADYLLVTDSIESGSISTIGNGIEQDGTYRYYHTIKNKFFSLLYGQGNPGDVTVYNLNNTGSLVQATKFQTETVQIQGAVQDKELFMMKVPRRGAGTAGWWRVDGESLQIVANGATDIVEIDQNDNGERCHFNGFVVRGNKIYFSYMSIKGDGSADSWKTDYPNRTNLAVYSYPDMQFQKIIRTENKTGSIGSYFNSGMVLDEKGDIYGFSPALTDSWAGNQKSTGPSGVVRVKNNVDEFDNSYFFDLQSVSGNRRVNSVKYLKNGKVFAVFYANADELAGGSKFAIVDVYNKTLSWISGVPEGADIYVEDLGIYVSQNKENVVFGVNNNVTNENYLYIVDVNNSSAMRGKKVVGGKITAVSMLEK